MEQAMAIANGGHASHIEINPGAKALGTFQQLHTCLAELHLISLRL
jgi:hypothetical protein